MLFARGCPREKAVISPWQRRLGKAAVSSCRRYDGADESSDAALHGSARETCAGG